MNLSQIVKKIYIEEMENLKNKELKELVLNNINKDCFITFYRDSIIEYFDYENESNEEIKNKDYESIEDFNIFIGDFSVNYYVFNTDSFEEIIKNYYKIN